MREAHELSIAHKDSDFRPTLRYRVPLIDSEDAFRAELIHLLGPRRYVFRDPSRKVLAFGSCFAQNISRAMLDMGRDVTTLVVTEDVNSPFNNLLLLKRVFLGEKSRFCDDLAAISHIDYEQTKDAMRGADDIIFTLGNVFHLEDVSGPTLHKHAHLVMESFEETRTYLQAIFTLLKTYTKAKIYVSVSPIPISGYKGEAFQTATEADCVSKCQLRVALNSILPKPRVVYMPTFEAFKWFAPHESFETLSIAGGNPRHLPESLIKTVMEELT